MFAFRVRVEVDAVVGDNAHVLLRQRGRWFVAARRYETENHVPESPGNS
jgi:hypothetical protein